MRGFDARRTAAAGLLLAPALLGLAAAGAIRHRHEPSATAQALGFTWAPQGRDLIVTSIADGGRAARAGLAIGDVVTAVDGHAPRRAFGNGPHRLAVLHHGMANERRLG